MLIISHAPILVVVTKCGLETPTFHKILTHINMPKDHLVIVKTFCKSYNMQVC